MLAHGKLNGGKKAKHFGPLWMFKDRTLYCGDALPKTLAVYSNNCIIAIHPLNHKPLRFLMMYNMYVYIELCREDG